ncbi:MAG: peptidase [Candidatus Latescibacteria bacterium]|nr:peptidase [Candidatus Latescibacterota bacterium]NIM64476.1 peptidase [Candidatus Latescibacterota bacterium]NIO00629.1 peptidase [Candidatus Latescibacterota bacterium]NIO27031.1 peptidase [Candidatus Latescibacterota bacterium]NIO54556.1 peptidase [Candidatus Latescibacterota bacterium]
MLRRTTFPAKLAAISFIVLILAIISTPFISYAQIEMAQKSDLPPGAISHEKLKKCLEMYAPVEASYDESILSEPEKAALKKLVQAAHIMDELFLKQVWEKNPETREMLRAALKQVQEPGVSEKQLEYMQDLYHFYRINFGPWDRINDDEIFFGSTVKPKGAGYYPTDITKEEFEKHLEANPGDAEAFRGYFTKIEREGGRLKAVPYSTAYKSLLAKAAKLQKEAADILTDPANKSKLPKGVDYTTLAKFLNSRADAYASNDYFQSDMDWMDVENNIIDVTIGPYEVYEDVLFGYKAAFEAFIAIRHPADSKKLDGLKGYLQAMENNLPIPDEHKNPNRGSESPISVVDVVFAAGDTKAGVQTIAFNLPNDERVREAKGSKKVMLKNISKAKFDKILMPIAKIVLDPTQLDNVEFESFFNNTLMHEFAHGLGPGKITLPDGRETTVSLELQEAYSAIEETKADITGLYNTALLAKEGFFQKDQLVKAYVTKLPGCFRAIRFGVHAAHGRANMIQFNFMKEKGAITFDPATETYHVHLDKMPAAVKALTSQVLMIQALGDYEAAKKMIETYGTMPPEVEKILKKFETLPIDIEPLYAAEKFIEG